MCEYGFQGHLFGTCLRNMWVKLLEVFSKVHKGPGHIELLAKYVKITCQFHHRRNVTVETDVNVRKHSLYPGSSPENRGGGWVQAMEARLKIVYFT